MKKRKKILSSISLLLMTTNLVAHSVTPAFATELPSSKNSQKEESLDKDTIQDFSESAEVESTIPSTEEEDLDIPVVEEDMEQPVQEEDQDFSNPTPEVDEETDNKVEEELIEIPIIEETDEDEIIESKETEEEIEGSEELSEEIPEKVEQTEEVEEIIPEEFQGLEEYNQSEIYDLAMQIMEDDLQSKSGRSLMMRSFSTGMPHVDSFFESIVPLAIEDSIQSGVLPSITIAQGALESAWGLSGLTKSANNLFGIKSSNDWNGKVHNIITQEYMPAKYDSKGNIIAKAYWYNVVAGFRMYNNWLESVNDHGKFFTSTEWRKNNYKHVIGEKDYRKAAQALLDSGYATDPGYANKLIAIIDNYGLYKYDEVPVLTSKYHVQKKGWLSKSGSSLTLGNAEEGLRVEDLRLNFPQNNDIGIQFSSHIQKTGWTSWVGEGNTAGNTGKSLRMEAIKMKLSGEAAKNYDIFYRVYSDTVGWSGWAKNGNAAGTEAYARGIESIEIKIAWKGDNPVTVSDSAFKVFTEPHVNYRTHLQYDGWITTVKDGALSGTTGKGRRLEALEVYLSSTPYAGSIQYQTHVQKYGWMDKVSNGATSGTNGEAKRVEAIKLNLTDVMAQEYDIYYRTHIQTYGWTGWAKNGQPSGSEGLGRRMEAMQIKLVKKGKQAPGSTANSFYK
ncbi:glucosaminidase domain-containing protein [Jeotgalibaca sp. MA1X17-3]|uniref:glucosaminidase domain-containing protein n=1 Tax=Jeotgalibaca sp. MA1X17-3 TaxID=2908211 RepID=UPI001F1A862F|nr:glucosaminidase domain-containing protein [Jeotgalibaca sp. MA1X17-3]UJF15235.1 glucosaminidase domain-containing protein [Jeotgalibaca sp. MA1X17-3]